ncbi:MAG: tRNA (adenosine(37)-N6)-threonylcarbamoyltransferase complex dimerization subunit type 1 TsaB [Tannerellaceae bacterium]|nr:tRNA (adenosine(37)-N6)-threonylcarbamoyltransferase complex dimerization subunit type 1 TsaB [Tannerellaceae bacterium]
MACILNIETSTTVCSVTLAKDSEIICDKYSLEGPSHAVLLGSFVEDALQVMKEAGYKLDAVAVSSGPGSYTGLRIGVSMAKGLCFGYNLPLIGITTLEILAAKAVKQIAEDNSLYCAMLDARRMEVYAAIYDKDLGVVKNVNPDIVTEDTYSSFLQTNKVFFFGNGADKCKEVIHSSNAFFVENLYPLASDMVPLSELAFIKGKFEDSAYFEPFYLKDFQPTVAKNKVLGSL